MAKNRMSDRVGGFRTRAATANRATVVKIKEVLVRLYKMTPFEANKAATEKRVVVERGMRGNHSNKRIASDLWRSLLH